MSLITLTLTFYPNPNPNPNPYIDLAHSSRRASLRLAAGLDRMSEAARLSQNPGDVVPSESQQSKRMSFFKGTHSLTHLPIPHLSTYQLTPLPNTHSPTYLSLTYPLTNSLPYQTLTQDQRWEVR